MSYPPLQPGDYYIENGKWVFTAQYHLRRGTCCGSACRHCPFEHVNVPEGKKVRKDGDAARGAAGDEAKKSEW